MFELSPFHPLNLALIALVSPIVIVVGFLLGRRADQWQKLIIAGFAAAFANAIALWFAVRFGALTAKGIGGEAGVFVLAFLFGTLWATLGYLTARRNTPER